ncbi:MAG: hypothetical protein GF398_03925 [Chitinivibrionales bacterium]|nr:hypothetical protein [Chitinivibrionales bacterium]
MNGHCSLLTAVVMVLIQYATAEVEHFSPHNVGAGAGFISGYGIQYRHWFPSRHGVQFSVGPYLNKSDNEEDFTISLGLNGLYIFKDSKFVNLFLYYGTHFWYGRSTLSYDPVAPGPAYDEDDNSEDYFTYFGAGPGFDIHFWRLSLNLQPGVAFRYKDNGNYGLQMSGEISLYYSF